MLELKTETHMIAVVIDMWQKVSFILQDAKNNGKQNLYLLYFIIFVEGFRINLKASYRLNPM
jgi:hypothetical protein